MTKHKKSKRETGTMSEGKIAKKGKPGKASSFRRSKNAEGVHSHTIAFPFMRLPVELQSIIVGMALEDANKGVRRPSNEVGNILSASRRFLDLGIPYVYRLITWAGHVNIIKLRSTLDLHPNHVAHLHEIDLLQTDIFSDAFQWFLLIYEAYRVAFETRLSSPYKLDKVMLSFPTTLHTLVIDVCRLFNPKHLSLFTGYDVDEEYPEDSVRILDLSFARFVTDVRLDEAWLSHLTILHLDGFDVDVRTSEVLSHLPSLAKVILTNAIDVSHSAFADFIRVLLSTGQTRTGLKSLLLHEPCPIQRRGVHQTIGVCLATLPIDLHPEKAAANLGPTSARVVLQGCQDSRIEYHKHSDVVKSVKRHRCCPRCCPLGDDCDEVHGSTSNPDLLRPQSENSMASDTGHSDMCTLHDGATLDDFQRPNFGQSDATFVQRRALECVRWIALPYSHSIAFAARLVRQLS